MSTLCDGYTMTRSPTRAVDGIYLSLIGASMRCPWKSFSSTTKQLIILPGGTLGIYHEDSRKVHLPASSKGSQLFPPIRAEILEDSQLQALPAAVTPTQLPEKSAWEILPAKAALLWERSQHPN